MKARISAWFRSFFPSHSLRAQLLSRSLLILAGLLLLIGLLQYVFMQEVIYRNKADSLQSQIMPLSYDILNQMTGSQYDEMGGLPRIFIPDANLAFIDQQGNYTVLFADDRSEIIPPRLEAGEYRQLLRRQPGPGQFPGRGRPGTQFNAGRPGRDYIVTNSGGAEQLVVFQPVIAQPGHELKGVLQISTPTAPLKELMIRQLLTFFLLSLIALFLGLLAYLPVLKKTLVPLSNMVDIAGQIDAGNLDSRFSTRQGQAEIDRLAESFNGMLQRLESSFKAERETQEQMRRFIADASHELRTPLTAIHGFLEVLLRGAANQPDQLEKALKSMHSESQRLNRLVHDLLLLSKLDRAPRIELQEGCLDAVIQEMEPQLHILAGDRKLELRIDSGLRCKYDTDQMKQVVLNLFHNAVQYTDPEQGHIQISLTGQEQGVQLSVQDNGPGISAEHLERVFDRFYRSDSSRTRKYGGAGLGLSISQLIVAGHGGKISVVSQEGQGTTFQVWLPAISG